MRFFLLKSEPDAFSWEEQVARGVEPWTGVRNAQAAAVLRGMELGDRAFFYHSNIGKEVVGIVEVVRTAYPDPTAEKGNWVCVDVRTVCPLPRPVPLALIRTDKRLEGIPLVRQSRLSCMALDPAHWQVICEMGGLVPAEAAA